jgi:hypothetical protein
MEGIPLIVALSLDLPRPDIARLFLVTLRAEIRNIT